MTCRSPRDLPSVGKLLEDTTYAPLLATHGETLLKASIREVLDDSRRLLLDGKTVELEQLFRQITTLLEPSQKRVLNLTGTVLHTNLGRAPLGDLLTAVATRLRGYSVLEFDLKTGKRGKRGEAVERLLRWATGAEAAVMVNNCSAAMVLLLTVLAKGKEVIVSRGELVEIGGSFRIPDILALSGAHLVEVGTTNRTRIGDFERAITENTGLILSTHRSNFEIVGFTESPTAEELISLGEKYDIPVAYDLGSGMLTRIVEKEPSVPDSSGFSLTAFSGDKLLGGPQCGVLVGQKALVERCRRHPFYRAFRCDKLTLALMEEALRRHAGQPESVPTVGLLKADLSGLRSRAAALLEAIKDVIPEDFSADVLDTETQVGGGSLPGGTISSAALRLTPPPGSDQKWQRRLREAETPMIVRLEKGSLFLEFRSLPECDDSEVIQGIRRIFT
jgi:L-seryl-tRNA(Ser) seleniumtransferase